LKEEYKTKISEEMEGLVPLMHPAMFNALTSFVLKKIHQAEQEGYKRGVKAVELPTYDHLKCLIRETCIGYQSAESDLQNVKDDLLSSLDKLTDKKKIYELRKKFF